jgi:hypothetical protein
MRSYYARSGASYNKRVLSKRPDDVSLWMGGRYC